MVRQQHVFFFLFSWQLVDVECRYNNMMEHVHFCMHHLHRSLFENSAAYGFQFWRECGLFRLLVKFFLWCWFVFCFVLSFVSCSVSLVLFGVNFLVAISFVFSWFSPRFFLFCVYWIRYLLVFSSCVWGSFWCFSLAIRVLPHVLSLSRLWFNVSRSLRPSPVVTGALLIFARRFSRFRSPSVLPSSVYAAMDAVANLPPDVFLGLIGLRSLHVLTCPWCVCWCLFLVASWGFAPVTLLHVQSLAPDLHCGVLHACSGAVVFLHVVSF